MKTYCISCKKNTANKSSRLMLLSNCAVGGKKNSRFIKNQVDWNSISSIQQFICFNNI